MLARRMTASSHFLAYLKVLPIVKQQGRGEERFKDWQNVLARILADDDRKAPRHRQHPLLHEDRVHGLRAVRVQRADHEHLHDRASAVTSASRT